jgi:hypothetical protein
LETHLILPPPSPQSTPRSPKRHVSLRVSHQRSACISVPLHACYKPAHHILLNFITLIISGETFLDIKYLYSVRQLMPTASAAAEWLTAVPIRVYLNFLASGKNVPPVVKTDFWNIMQINFKLEVTKSKWRNDCILFNCIFTGT